MRSVVTSSVVTTTLMALFYVIRSVEAVLPPMVIETDDPMDNFRPFIVVPGSGNVVVDPDTWTAYPTGPPVPTPAPTPWPTASPTPAPPQSYILLEGGDASTCPSGTQDVEEEYCLEAAAYLKDAYLGPSYSFPYYLNTDSGYGGPPCGCFLRVKDQRDQILPEYNGNTTGCKSGKRTRLICALDLPLPANTQHDMTQYNKAYASGSLVDGTEDSSHWDYATLSAGDFYIRRVCLDCVNETHTDIVYYRRTPLPVGFNVETLFLTSWTEDDNEFHTDFELYSNMPYAFLNFLPWSYCNFALYGGVYGFPYECGRTEATLNNWNSLSGGYGGGSGITNYAFYVWGGTYTPPAPGAYSDIEGCRNTEECGHDPSKPYYMDYIDGTGTARLRCLAANAAQSKWNNGYGCGVSPDWSTLLDPCYDEIGCMNRNGPYHLSFINNDEVRVERCLERQTAKIWAVHETTYCVGS